MLREDLNDAPALGARRDIPLEVATAFVEDSVKLIRDEFVRREDPEICRISNGDRKVSILD